MSNGVSKKLCITGFGIAMIVQLGENAPDKLPYAIAVAAIVVVYKLIQGAIDWRSAGKKMDG